MHYRTMAEVMEVIFLDYRTHHGELYQAIHTTIRWYWASYSPRVSTESLAELRTLGQTMRQAWELAFADAQVAPTLQREGADIPKGSFDALPKMHRAVAHLPDFLRLYGPYSTLTTEVSEAANKPLKMCFRT